MLLNSVNTSIGLMLATAQLTKKSENASAARYGNTAGNASLHEQSRNTLRQNSLALITARLSAGKIISTAERRYLRNNDPESYRRASMLETERKLYRRRLKKARTKDEVRKLNVSASAQMVADARAAGRPGASGTASGSLDVASMRSSAIRDEHGAFVNTREFRNLPENIYELKRAKRKAATGNARSSAAANGARAASGAGRVGAPQTRGANVTVGASGSGGYRKRGVSLLV